MANYTYTDHVGDGTTTTFPFTFVGPGKGYINRSHVYVYVNGLEALFSFTSTNQVTISPAPVDGASVRIRRIMPKDKPFADFSRGNVFSQDSLNDSFLQSLYVYHEFLDGFLDEFPWKLQGNVEVLGELTANGMLLSGDLNMQGNRIINLPTPALDNEAVPFGLAKGILEGAEVAADRAEVAADRAEAGLGNTGWLPAAGSFEAGGTITERNQYLQLVTTVGSDVAGGYSWGGALPKAVAAGSTPATTGGTGADAWVYRSDAALRSALAAADSAVLVGGVGAGEIAASLGLPIERFGGLGGAIAASVQGGRVAIPKGELVGNFVSGKVELFGGGSNTRVKALSTDPAYTFDRHGAGGLNDWDYYRVQSITFDGNLKASNAITFGSDPFSGRWSFDNVCLQNANVGVLKSTGNIGDNYYNASYGVCNYGYRALSNPSMHTGATVHYASHWEVIAQACFYINDSLDGCGQWVIRDSIMEQCGGFGVFMNLNNKTPYTPPVFDNLWMEAIATSATVSIDAVDMTPRQYYFKDTPFARIRDSYLFNVELVNSRVHADGVRIDDAYLGATPKFIIGPSSKLTVDNLYANGIISGGPFVNSIINQQSDSLVKQLSVRGPLKTNKIPLSNLANATDVCSNSFSGTGPWLFVGTTSRNVTSVADGVLNSTCGEILINPGETLLGPEVSSPAGNRFAVWGIHAKLQSGDPAGMVGIIGGNSTLGSIYLRNTGEWVCSYGVQPLPATVNTVRLQFIHGGAAACTIRLADFFCVTFTTAAEAYDFVNSGYSAQKVI